MAKVVAVIPAMPDEWRPLWRTTPSVARNVASVAATAGRVGLRAAAAQAPPDKASAKFASVQFPGHGVSPTARVRLVRVTASSGTPTVIATYVQAAATVHLRCGRPCSGSRAAGTAGTALRRVRSATRTAAATTNTSRGDSTTPRAKAAGSADRARSP